MAQASSSSLTLTLALAITLALTQAQALTLALIPTLTLTPTLALALTLTGKLELKEIGKQLRRGADVKLDSKLQARYLVITPIARLQAGGTLPSYHPCSSTPSCRHVT